MELNSNKIKLNSLTNNFFSGSRFALMQIKLILYHILSNFLIEVSEKTVVPLRFSKGARFEPEGSIIDLKRRFFK